MCEYFYIEFIDFTLNGESLLDYTNFFSYQIGKHDKMILDCDDEKNQLHYVY